MMCSLYYYFIRPTAWYQNGPNARK